MSAEQLQTDDDRLEIIRTALTEQIERWGCMSEFTEEGILYAARVIFLRDIDYEGREMQAEYQRRSKERKLLGGDE